MTSFNKPPTVSDDYRAVDIYRKAAGIIFERGYNATSMGDIADIVDLTKGGLYYYIKGKEALLFAIMNFAMDMLDNEVLAKARELETPLERLTCLVAGHLRLVLRDQSAMSILVHDDLHLAPEHRAKIVSRKRAYTYFLRDTIGAALAGSGVGRSIDPVVASYGLLGMIHWVVRWYRPDGRLDQDQVVAQLTHLALQGVFADYPDNRH
jgi:AcrR family transcriptional regulator